MPRTALENRHAQLARHGHTSISPEGKVVRSPTYISWQNMKARCLYPSTPSYPHYGARGITVCERWIDFRSFLADMGIRPEGTEISRIDNDGNYEPGNCEWVTKAENLAERQRRCPTKPTPASLANLVPGAGRGRSCEPGCSCGRHRRRAAV